MEHSAAKSLSDQELMRLIVGGQLSLFDVCFKRYRRAVIDFLQYRTFNKEDAEDLAQEVFVKAYNAFENGGYDLEQSYLKTWLMRIALNQYFDWCRKKKVRPQLSRDESLVHYAQNMFLHTATPERLLITKESLGRINSLIETLTPLDAGVIRLRFINDESYADMIKILNVPEGTLKGRLNRARKKLMQKILERGIK